MIFAAFDDLGSGPTFRLNKTNECYRPPKVRASDQRAEGEEESASRESLLPEWHSNPACCAAARQPLDVLNKLVIVLRPNTRTQDLRLWHLTVKPHYRAFECGGAIWLKSYFEPPRDSATRDKMA